jgi:hypothetical protein
MRQVTKTRLRQRVAAAMKYVAKTVRLRPFMALLLAPVGCVLVLTSLACNCAALLRHAAPSHGSICSSLFLLMQVQTANG